MVIRQPWSSKMHRHAQGISVWRECSCLVLRLFACFLWIHFRQCASAVPPVLSAPVPSSGQFQFTLSGDTNAPYIIETSTNLQSWKAVSTNNEALASRSIVVAALEPQAFYRARQAAPFFGYAIATVGRIDLKGNSLAADSFDSGDPL